MRLPTAQNTKAYGSATNLGLFAKLERIRMIIVALMLRDIRTRFFGSAWGYVIAILWPLSHIMILVTIYNYMGIPAPYGDSTALWFATGITAFLAFQYCARFISLGLLLNRALLVYPVITVNDILISRTIIEVLNTIVVVILVIVILMSFGVSVSPNNVTEAFYALGACLMLGVGFGSINAIITFAVPAWLTGYALFSILMWMLSGVMFIPSNLPDPFDYILSFNPALHGVEWMRTAYFEGYSSRVLDKTYMLQFSFVSLLIGLAVERFFRGRLLQG